MIRSLLLFAVALTLGGCATFTETELSQVSSRGVSPRLVAKLDRGGPLALEEVIELSRRRVPETWIIRQLDDHGVASLVTRSDVSRLRRARIHPAVIDAVLRASDQFAAPYRYGNGSGFDYYGSPYNGFYDPWAFNRGFGGLGGLGGLGMYGGFGGGFGGGIGFPIGYGRFNRCR